MLYRATNIVYLGTKPISLINQSILAIMFFGPFHVNNIPRLDFEVLTQFAHSTLSCYTRFLVRENRRFDCDQVCLIIIVKQLTR